MGWFSWLFPKKSKNHNITQSVITGHPVEINPTAPSTRSYQRNLMRMTICREMLDQLELDGKKDTEDYELWFSEYQRRAVAVREYHARTKRNTK